MKQVTDMDVLNKLRDFLIECARRVCVEGDLAIFKVTARSNDAGIRSLEINSYFSVKELEGELKGEQGPGAGG